MDVEVPRERFTCFICKRGCLNHHAFCRRCYMNIGSAIFGQSMQQWLADHPDWRKRLEAKSCD